MGRYDQRKSNKLSNIMIIVFVIILISLTIWYFQSAKIEEGKEIKRLDIPIVEALTTIEKVVASYDQAINDKLIKETGSEQVQIIELEKILAILPELPKLVNSDNSFRMSMEEISESLVYWLNFQDIIKRYIVLINDLSQKQILFKHRKFLKIPGEIVVREDSQGLYLAKTSYRRFDHLANAIESIDVQKAIRLFLTFKPLFKQVFDDFAYPAEHRLEDIFLKAAASVIEAPIIRGRVSLLKHAIRYKFADQKLEKLNGVEKQMLRMGPMNTEKIQNKLRQFVEALSVINE